MDLTGVLTFIESLQVNTQAEIMAEYEKTLPIFTDEYEDNFFGPNITQTCNPVTGRLIIFFTDILMPFYLNSIIISKTSGEAPLTVTFNLIFNFIFYHIFNEYSENEKKWVIQQINTILNKLPEKYHDIFKKSICINLETTPFEVKEFSELNFVVVLDKTDVEQNKIIEELKRVMKRCLPFWKIETGRIFPCDFQPSDTNYKIVSSFYFNTSTDSGLFLVPIQVNIKSPEPMNEKLAYDLFYSLINFENLKSINTDTQNFMELFQSQRLIREESKSKSNTSFIILLICLKIKYPEINKKIHFYPETYDEMYTLFSNISQRTIDEILLVLEPNKCNPLIRDLLLPWIAPVPKDKLEKLEK